MRRGKSPGRFGVSAWRRLLSHTVRLAALTACLLGLGRDWAGAAAASEAAAGPPVTAVVAPQAPLARSALPATLPLRRDGDTSGGDGLGPIQALTVLGLLAVLVGGVAWRRTQTRHIDERNLAGGWRRWLVPIKRSDGLRVKQSLRLTPRASVHVLDWDGQELLVASTNDTVTVLERRAPSVNARDRAVASLSPEDT